MSIIFTQSTNFIRTYDIQKYAKRKLVRSGPVPYYFGTISDRWVSDRHALTLLATEPSQLKL